MAASLKRELDHLLDEEPGDADARAASTLDAIFGPLGTRPLVLFGAGSLGRKTLAALREIGLEPRAIADNDASKSGQTLEGVPILPIEEIAQRYGADAAVLVTIYSAGHRYCE